MRLDYLCLLPSAERGSQHLCIVWEGVPGDDTLPDGSLHSAAGLCAGAVQAHTGWAVEKQRDEIGLRVPTR